MSSASVMSFSGPAARACPAAADADGDEGFAAGCEIHTQEALLTPAALRPSAKHAPSARLARTDGDRHSGVRSGTPSQVGSMCSSRSRRTKEDPPRSSSAKRNAESLGNGGGIPVPPTAERIAELNKRQQNRRARTASPRAGRPQSSSRSVAPTLLDTPASPLGLC